MQKITETDLGFIFKAETVDELYKIIDDVFEATPINIHNGFPFNKNCVKSHIANPQIFKHFLGYGFMNRANKVTSGIIWKKGFEITTKIKILTSFLWVSEEKKVSLKLFKKSLEDINSFYDYNQLVCGNSFDNKKLEKFYKRLNFKKANIFYKNITKQ